MVRYRVLLKQDARGWWWRKPTDKHSWGPYKTEGYAKGAAKRSLTKVIGGRTNPNNYHFEKEGGGALES